MGASTLALLVSVSIPAMRLRRISPFIVAALQVVRDFLLQQFLHYALRS
jgi:hypothetical protein